MSRTSKSYNVAAEQVDWREWSSDFWHQLVQFSFRGQIYYRKIIAPRCRQCRRLPGFQRWTGGRICACGNPFINSLDRLPAITRYMRGIRPWDKPLTSREKAEVRAWEKNRKS